MRDPTIALPHIKRANDNIINSTNPTSKSPANIANVTDPTESMSDRIMRVYYDMSDIINFYKVRFSPTRYERLGKFYDDELAGLEQAPFEQYGQEEQVDFLLLKNYLLNNSRQLHQNAEKDSKMLPYLGTFFPFRLAGLIQARQIAKALDGKDTAILLTELMGHIASVKDRIVKGQEVTEPSIALRAATILAELKVQMQEWYAFYEDYDPLFTWWVSSPYSKLDQALGELVDTIKTVVLGLDLKDEDKIIGEPIGRASLLDALDLEMIPYTPEELIEIAKKEYAWCEEEMTKAAQAMGHPNWRTALEAIKNDYVEPGKQPQLVRDLTFEATGYVKKHDLVTVPPVCEETWQTFMMSPEAQKMNPWYDPLSNISTLFFLGGDSIIVSYPTSSMAHDQKLMSMRGNNKHFARATVFHEMIPGHHLHMYYLARHRPYRRIFDTPFSIEGWAFYWEMVLYASDSWEKRAENKIGMLFWRMHRCARIVFSLNFHLGLMTPEECVELLLNWVGHERATAEGEVRRSVMGDYGPLYQAGYMLGGIQLYKLRKEMVDSGKLGEKDFHDKFLKANMMPIEMFRALISGQELDRDFKTKWKFYES